MNPVESTPRTKHARINEDIAEKLGEVVEATGMTTAEYLDPLIRTKIENDHKENFAAIKVLRSARAKAAERRKELAAAHAPDLGESGA